MRGFGLGRTTAALTVLAVVSATVLLVLGHYRPAGVLLSLALLALTALLLDLRRQVRALGRQARQTTAAARGSRVDLAPVLAQVDGVSTTVKTGVQQVGARLDEMTQRLDEQSARLGEAVREQQAERTAVLSTLSALTDRVDDLEGRTRELLYTVRMVPQDVEAQAMLHDLVPARAALPVTGGWGLDARTLLAVVSLLTRVRPAHVVELGSGASTVWMGYVLQRHGGTLVSLEHLDDFARDTRRAVDEHGLGSTVDVRLSPLRPLDLADRTWSWYDPAAIQDVGPVDLVLVDGPPKSAGPLSRYPALPMLLPLLADEAWVLLDDARRPDEREVLRRWLDECSDLREVQTSSDDLAVLHYLRTTPTTS